jgi:hypothetical protein
VPELLDLGDIDGLQRRERLFRKARRNTDSQAAGQKLQQGPAPVGIERIEPFLEKALHVVAQGAPQRIDDFGQGRLGRRAFVPCRPDERDSLREIAHVIMREREQFRVHARFNRLANDGRLRDAEAERAGQRRKRPAAFRIRRVAEIVAHQCQLRIARRRESEPVEEAREGAHQVSSSSP